MKGHKISKEGHQPHLVYKRSALSKELHLTRDDEHKDTETCGVKGKGISFFLVLFLSFFHLFGMITILSSFFQIFSSQSVKA